MHVMVLGAGVTGVTTAWFLHKAGFEVSIVDRQPEAGLETSFANGGQISVSHPEPWANPSAPLLALRWLGREDAPLLFRPRARMAQWRWALSFLHECLPWRSRRNTRAIASLAIYSASHLRALRAETGITYDQLQRGILHLFFSAAEFRHAPVRAVELNHLGIAARACTADECFAVEPALQRLAGRLAGGIYAQDDESGDAFRFTQALAGHLRSVGVRFHYGTTIERLDRSGEQISGIEVRDSAGRTGTLSAEAYVLCLGSFSPAIVAPLGQRLPIYPVKGYSVTAPIVETALAPQVSLTDESRRIVCSRLGDRLRIAGTAELNGFDANVRPERGRAILDWVNDRLPGAIDPAQAQLWAGLRPATPGNIPLIGKGWGKNLWYNTGHGTLGWTLSCGSAAALTELMQGRRPAPDFPFRPGA
ncbi:FAD-dependent oxidoreductase [Azoarcus indigens]|uniref:Glycine/D-amino acid oxidase-like deaminating enzyme n=1 Tax=Azoarcus indigens TaxID=29545 RepID=A0A4R6DYC4_9RHOO|nr:D-amino acid dehydrogenase [Azoarcus indigens]NMG66365.1 FAD-dependent oxidoreductase [Azoarcus indigens]TDN50340.1 glycine/D-amino acid oxidase-like deaminating enzyme [Azoarcus indigens]